MHILVRIPPKNSFSEIMGDLIEKSSLMIFEKHTKLSYKYENDTFGVKDFSGESYKENTRIYCKSVKKYPETE